MSRRRRGPANIVAAAKGQQLLSRRGFGTLTYRVSEAVFFFLLDGFGPDKNFVAAYARRSKKVAAAAEFNKKLWRRPPLGVNEKSPRRLFSSLSFPLWQRPQGLFQ